jgi:hypothetical protein
MVSRILLPGECGARTVTSKAAHRRRLRSKINAGSWSFSQRGKVEVKTRTLRRGLELSFIGLHLQPSPSYIHHTVFALLLFAPNLLRFSWRCIWFLFNKYFISHSGSFGHRKIFLETFESLRVIFLETCFVPCRLGYPVACCEVVYFSKTWLGFHKAENIGKKASYHRGSCRQPAGGGYRLSPGTDPNRSGRTIQLKHGHP